MYIKPKEEILHGVCEKTALQNDGVGVILRERKRPKDLLFFKKFYNKFKS
jgi:hypothetical protein